MLYGQENASDKTPFKVKISLLAAMILSLSPLGAAWADLGGVGSPVQNNVQQPAIEPNDQGDDSGAGGNILGISDNRPDSKTAAMTMGRDVTASENYRKAIDYTQSAGSQNDAVMVIRFNQQYVYYENPLRKVISKVDTTRPEATYELQSVVPSKASRYDSDKYEQNVQNVIGIFGRNGVASNRVFAKTVVSDSVKNQEINIFVH